MKRVIKNLVKVTTLLVLVVNLTACSDDDVINIGPSEPMVVSIGFGLEFAPQTQTYSKNSIQHNYIDKGYTVIITGGVANNKVEFTNVDLTKLLNVEVLGDVTITVVHPKYFGTSVDTKAYYATMQPITFSPEPVNTIDLDLVQGFVQVTSDDEIEHMIKEVQINGVKVNLDEVYYLGSVEAKVKVIYTGGELNGSHTNVFGDGKIYNVTTSQSGINFTFPEFNNPGDGIWFPN